MNLIMENWRGFLIQESLSKVEKALRDEGGAAGLDAIKKHTKLSADEIKSIVSSASNIKVHTDGDYILVDQSLDEEKNKEGKERGSDGKACWDGYRHAGTEDGKDKCVPMEEGNEKGLWDNIHAKRKRGEKPAKKGDEDYPDTLDIEESVLNQVIESVLQTFLYEKKKKPCKPSKGKRSAKRVDGKCRSFGQAGKAKDGGDRIRPGTAKGDAYCARSAKIKKCKEPPCANDLSRKKWKCKGSKSVA